MSPAVSFAHRKVGAMRFAIASILLNLVLVTTQASASVISADHPDFGPGSLTRDTGQGLDFLDLTLSTGNTYNNMLNEFGPGGAFEGFRHATRAEVTALVNNWGFSPNAVVGLRVQGDTGDVDQLGGLVDLLGATTFFTLPQGPGIYGYTGDEFSASSTYYMLILDSIGTPGRPDLTEGTDVVRSDGAWSRTDPRTDFGHFLVMASVPEASEIALGALGGLGLITFRRRQRVSAVR